MSVKGEKHTTLKGELPGQLPARPRQHLASDIKFEIVVIPVSYVDRPKHFYTDRPGLEAGLADCRQRDRTGGSAPSQPPVSDGLCHHSARTSPCRAPCLPATVTLDRVFRHQAPNDLPLAAVKVGEIFPWRRRPCTPSRRALFVRAPPGDRSGSGRHGSYARSRPSFNSGS